MKRNKFRKEPWGVKGRYVHHDGPYRFSAYHDGWSESSWEYPTYREAAACLFPEVGAGGYALTYYPIEDGCDNPDFEVCGACALELWLENPDQRFRVEHGDSDRRYSESVVCEACRKVIDEQKCPECGAPLTEKNTGTWNDAPLPLFAHDQGYVLHGRCMAALVEKRQARHTGRGTYEVTGMWTSGEFRADYLEAAS